MPDGAALLLGSLSCLLLGRKLSTVQVMTVYDICGVIWASNIDWEGNNGLTTELDSHTNMAIVEDKKIL